MVRKSVTRLGLVLTAVAIVVGMTAVPAAAEEASISDNADVVTEAPDGIDEAEWVDVLNDAKADYGDGDKAQLEALKSVSPLLVEYCTTSYYMPSGHRIPLRSGGWYDCVMEVGLVSSGVTALQQTLNHCYGRSLTLDGDFGPATYNALMYAQGRAGIAVDGVYGTQTRLNINWWNGGSSCTKGSTLGL